MSIERRLQNLEEELGAEINEKETKKTPEENPLREKLETNQKVRNAYKSARRAQENGEEIDPEDRRILENAVENGD
ncbi:MAG: hypothetical protein K9L56_15075 [Clostridiales bacterium]|nr:hypothetical protein [Clostridiales bacterium]